MRATAIVMALAACGGGSTAATDAATVDLTCTPESRHVEGTVLAFESLGELNADVCPRGLIRSSQELATAFAGGPVPANLASVDFTVDRVVIGETNPAIMFVVDNGTALVVAEQAFCQGAAPRCAAVIVHSTRDAMVNETCPYRGPNPCEAP